MMGRLAPKGREVSIHIFSLFTSNSNVEKAPQCFWRAFRERDGRGHYKHRHLVVIRHHCLLCMSKQFSHPNTQLALWLLVFSFCWIHVKKTQNVQAIKTSFLPQIYLPMKQWRPADLLLPPRRVSSITYYNISEHAKQYKSVWNYDHASCPAAS